MPKLTLSINNNFNAILVKIITTLLLIAVLISISNQIQAAQFQQDPQYGNGQSTSFINAMYGTNSNVTTKELESITNSIPSNINRFFIRFGANNGTSSITKIKNTSVQDGITTATIATTNATANSKYGGEIATGYRWDKFSLELEFMITENMKYNTKKLFSNLAGSLNSTVKAQSIFLNSYYDFVSFKAFRIFAGLGFGAGINRTNSNFFNNATFATGETFARRKVAGAYNLVLGCKLNIVPQLFLIGSMRYTNFAGFGNIKLIATSNLEWRDESQNLHLEGQHTLVGFSINLIHIFL
jgi:hypothetical protein